MSMVETMATATPPILQAALDYARRGIPVFPCSIEKKPLTQHGFKDASTEPVQIASWWERWPSAIIGVPTGQASGWAVLDLDHKPNKFGVLRDGSAALLNLLSGELMPDTVEAVTPSGGRHIFFRHCEGFKCSSDDELGIDVRAEGGYVCVPPSPGYRFVNPPGLFDLADAPDCVIDILSHGTRKRVHQDHAPTAPIATPDTDETNAEDVETILHEFWNPDDYHDWSTAALAMHSLPDGYAIWSKWAAKSPKFNAAENLKKWNQTVPKRNITARSILARAPRNRLSELARERVDPLRDMPFINGTRQPIRPKPAEAGLNPDNPPSSRFQWITRENGLQPVLNSNWLVKHVLPAEGLGVIFGRPGSGKTFTVMDIAMHVAAGMPWRGKKVRAAAVSYVSPEAGRLGVNRVIGWSRHHGIPWPEGFRLSPAAINLCSSAEDAEALIADVQANQPDCRLVVIDTLNRAMAGGDENSGEDMGRFVALCDHIAKRLRAFVLVVHHSGKDAAKGSRGHSSLLGAVSLELEVTKEQGNPGTIKVTKMRDGEDGAEYGFDIDSVPLGVDEDGEEVTTGISIEADVDQLKASRAAEPKGAVQKTIAEAFDQYVDDHGKPNPAGTGFAEPGRVRVVNEEAFLDFAAGKLVGGEKRKRTRQGIGGLVNKGYFVVNGGYIWRV